MENIQEHIVGHFCAEIENKIRFIHLNWRVPFKVKLQRRNVTEKLELINSERIKIIKILEQEDCDYAEYYEYFDYYNYAFKPKDIKTKLISCLEEYYKKIEMTLPIFGLGSNFSFTDLNQFKSLPNYIAWSKQLLSLDKLEVKFKKGKISNQKKQLPIMGNKVEEFDEFPDIEFIPQSEISEYTLEIPKSGEEKFKRFINETTTTLLELCIDNNDLIAPISSIENDETKITKSAESNENEIMPLNLSDIFESASRYDHIMGILADKKLIHPITHIWIDEKNNYKKYLVVILKQLHSLGYYKNNKKLSNKQIMEICLNTFGLEIGIDLIKHTPLNCYNIKELPIASTLKS